MYILDLIYHTITKMEYTFVLIVNKILIKIVFPLNTLWLSQASRYEFYNMVYNYHHQNIRLLKAILLNTSRKHSF